MTIFRIAPKGYEAANPDGRLILVLAHAPHTIPELPEGATYAVEHERLVPHFTLPQDLDQLHARLLEWGSVDFARRYKVVVYETITRTYDVMALSREAARLFGHQCAAGGDTRALVSTESTRTTETHRA